MLDIDGTANERIRNSGFLSLRVGEVRCRHRRGMVDERFGPPETHGKRERSEFIEDSSCFGTRRVQLERDDTAEPVYLFASEAVLGMLLQSGIIDLSVAG